MKKTYTHITHFERGRIFIWYHYQKTSIREIARRLNRSHSTISRELRRNKSHCYIPTWYPNIADLAARIRLSKRAQRIKLKSTHNQQYVVNRLKAGWSPEIIAGHMKHHSNMVSVSHEAIYQYIYKESPEHQRRRERVPFRKEKAIKYEKTMIDDRPEVINNREAYAHCESDSIESADRKGGLNVLVERSSRLTPITKLKSKKSCQTKKAIQKRL